MPKGGKQPGAGAPTNNRNAAKGRGKSVYVTGGFVNKIKELGEKRGANNLKPYQIDSYILLALSEKLTRDCMTYGIEPLKPEKI